MAIAPAIDLDEAFIVPTGSERTAQERDFGSQPVNLARMADANSPGKTVGLWANHANIATQIDLSLIHI